MSITIVYRDYYIQERRMLNQQEEAQILASPNAMKGFTEPVSVLPHHDTITYVALYYETKFAGAIIMFPSPYVKDSDELHLLLREQFKSKAKVYYDLVAMYCQLANRRPITTVNKSPDLQYMYNFMIRSGAKVMEIPDKWIFYMPKEWRPQFAKKGVVVTYD